MNKTLARAIKMSIIPSIILMCLILAVQYGHAIDWSFHPSIKPIGIPFTYIFTNGYDLAGRYHDPVYNIPAFIADFVIYLFLITPIVYIILRNRLRNIENQS